MTTQIIREEPAPQVVQTGGSSVNAIMLTTFVSLVVVAIAVLLILHFTIGVA